MNQRKIKSLVNNLCEMTPREANEVVSRLENALGKATATSTLNLLTGGLSREPVPSRKPQTFEEAVNEWEPIFLKLVSYPYGKKIPVIKVVREGVGRSYQYDQTSSYRLSVREAKNLVDQVEYVPVLIGTKEVGSHLSKSELLSLFQKLTDLGAEVEIWKRN